jgi:hypothetical protein
MLKFFLPEPSRPARKSFLASHTPMNSEPLQRTNISTQPLGPTNYTGSNTATCKCKAVSRVQTLTTKPKPSGVTIVNEMGLARPKGKGER